MKRLDEMTLEELELELTLRLQHVSQVRAYYERKLDELATKRRRTGDAQ